ncbi:zona pellucida-like domain-containing protein 1 isoform X4 [Pleurodeles waltl]
MYDPLLLALNGNHNQSNCLGKLDNSSSPPVVSYAFPLNDTTQNACGNVIQIQDEAGSGIFNDFSTIQTVVLSGFVSTPSIASSGTISYSTSLYYNFSCHYPLQYLINQTRLSTYSVSVAVNTNNGSFISTLSMKLFLDANFSMTLDQNGTALPLKTRIYVQIDATGLAANCSIQDRTEVFANGNSKRAQFSFETFRFIKYVNQKPCTIFLHCITRLCQPEQCAQFLQGCSQGTNVTGSARRKRASAKASTAPLEGTSSSVTVSSGPIYTVDEASTGIGPSSGSLFGLLIGLIIAVILSTGLIVASITTYKLYHLRATQAALKYAVNSGSNGQGIYMIPTMQPQPL